MKTKKPLYDTFKRKHDYLRISLTERCNLRCFYCMPAEGIPLRDKSHFMTSEEIFAIAKTFVDLGITKIRLTGGEPLVKKDAANIIKQLGSLPIDLSITTNAILVDKFINVFKEAGIKSVNVSLDSLEEDNFNKISRRTYFSKIMENIQLLLDNDFHVKINVVVVKDVNDHEIIDFIKWTKDTNIHIRFIEFMPFDGNNWKMDNKIAFEEIITRATAVFGATGFQKIQDKPNDTTRNFQLKDGKGTFGIISTVTNPFCDSCNRIRLTADGKLKNCLFSQTENDILSAYRNKQDIEPLIRQHVMIKKKARGGMALFNDENVKTLKNRTMISIGG